MPARSASTADGETPAPSRPVPSLQRSPAGSPKGPRVRPRRPLRYSQCFEGPPSNCTPKASGRNHRPKSLQELRISSFSIFTATEMTMTGPVAESHDNGQALPILRPIEGNMRWTGDLTFSLMAIDEASPWLWGQVDFSASWRNDIATALRLWSDVAGITLSPRSAPPARPHRRLHRCRGRARSRDRLRDVEPCTLPGPPHGPVLHARAERGPGQPPITDPG